MNGQRWRALRWLPAWLALGRLGLVVTIVLSLVPLPDTGIRIEQGDKYGHALVWFLLTAWYGQLCATRRALASRALGFVALGGLVELAQGLTSFRSCDWRDFLADAIGVVAGWALSRTRAARALEWLEVRLSRPRIDAAR